MAKRKPRPELTDEDGLTEEELRLANEARQLVEGVEKALAEAGLAIRGLTVAGGEGVVILTGTARTAAVARQASEVAAAVPGVTEVVNSITVRG